MTRVSPGFGWMWTTSFGSVFAIWFLPLGQRAGQPDDCGRVRGDQVAAQLRPQLRLVAVEGPAAVELDHDVLPVHVDDVVHPVDVDRVCDRAGALRLGDPELRRREDRHAPDRGRAR